MLLCPYRCLEYKMVSRDATAGQSMSQLANLRYINIINNSNNNNTSYSLEIG